MAKPFVMVNGIKTQEMSPEPVGDLTPIGPRFRIGRFFFVVCECACGKVVVSSYQNMTYGNVVSCGCRRSSERRSKPSRVPPCGAKRFPPGPHKLAFLQSVADTDECIAWPYGVDHYGYGVLTVDGERTLAHRKSAEIHHGAPPDGQLALHGCGNKICVNPRHLSWGTQRENFDDAVRNGEMAHSENNGMAKLTNAQVSKIKLMLNVGAHTVKQLAEMYGRNYLTIYAIKTGTTWRRVQLRPSGSESPPFMAALPCSCT